MNICEELAAGFMTGFLISVGRERTHANQQGNGMVAASESSTRQFIVLFGPLTPDVACKLRPYLKATPDLGGTSTTIDDLHVQKRALALIARALEYVDREGPFIDAELEYREG